MGFQALHRLCRRAAAGAVLAVLAVLPAGAQDLTAQVLDLVNQARAANGLPPVKRNARLDAAALRHSTDMAVQNFFSHTGSDGSSAGRRITEAGYDWWTYGENIAAGYTSAESVMRAWLDSPGHRANIMNPGFKEIGVALVIRPGTTYRTYWTQDFGAEIPGSLPPPPPVEASVNPVLSLLSPTRGAVGSEVTLTGRLFGAATGTVRFNGVVAPIRRWSGTQIVAVVPNGATTGPVRVSTGAATSEGQTFTVTIPPTGSSAPPPPPPVSLAAPRLIRVTPDHGPPGTRVVLTGENFGATQGSSRVLFFGSVRVIQWSSTRITLDLFSSVRGLRLLQIQRSDGRLSNSVRFIAE